MTKTSDAQMSRMAPTVRRGSTSWPGNCDALVGPLARPQASDRPPTGAVDARHLSEAVSRGRMGLGTPPMGRQRQERPRAARR